MFLTIPCKFIKPSNASVDTKGLDTSLCGDFNTPQEGLYISFATRRYYLKGVLINCQPSAVWGGTWKSIESNLHARMSRSQAFERSSPVTRQTKLAHFRWTRDGLGTTYTHVREIFLFLLTRMHTLTILKSLSINPALKPLRITATRPLQTCHCSTTTSTTVVGKRHSIIDEKWAAVFWCSWSREWPRYCALNTSKSTSHTTAKPGPWMEVCKGDSLEFITAVFPSCRWAFFQNSNKALVSSTRVAMWEAET